MKRLSKFELADYLRCPVCHGDIRADESEIVCDGCGKAFLTYRDKPVLIRDDNPLFSRSAYVVSGKETNTSTGKVSMKAKIKKLIPSKSVNLARERMFTRLHEEHGKTNKTILVVGCGNQMQQLERHFPEDMTTFVFTDIDKNSDADIFCDAHDLAFKDQEFDGVISTAVLEHVLYPEKVVGEIYRVLKNDGFLYSEIPFLQSVHEGAYDFTRFTMSGHRRLLEDFNEIDAGMVAGPGTALVWSIVDFAKALFSQSKISSLSALSARGLFFWLKYFDYLFVKRPAALDSASCTYFYGTKSRSKSYPSEIIEKYIGESLEHV